MVSHGVGQAAAHGRISTVSITASDEMKAVFERCGGHRDTGGRFSKHLEKSRLRYREEERGSVELFIFEPQPRV